MEEGVKRKSQKLPLQAERESGLEKRLEICLPWQNGEIGNG